MSILKVTNIQHGSASSAAITLANDGTATAKVTNLPQHNLVINGDFRIAQRSSAVAASSDMVTVDRFAVTAANHDAGPDQAQVALTSSDTGPWAKGHRFAYQLTNGDQTGGAGTSDRMEIYTMLEAQDIASSGWDYTSTSSYITLSFWVKSSVAQNFFGYLLTDDGTAQSYAFETGALSANTWAKVTKTIPGNANLTFNNDANNGLGIFFCNFLGTGLTGTAGTLNTWVSYTSTQRTPDNTSTWWTTNDATFALTGIQLTVTDYAPDFPVSSYGEELRRCQRYFYLHAAGNNTDAGEDKAPIGMGYGYTSTNGYVMVPFPVEMRAIPSLYKVQGTDFFHFAYNNNNAYPNAVALNRTTTMTCEVNFNTGASWDANASGMFRTSDSAARIGFLAEI